MGLYGREECIFNEHHPNPYYMANCHNSKVEKDTVTSIQCNNCKLAKLPKINSNSTLEELLEEVKKLEGRKRKMAKVQMLKILKGYTQPWEVL